MMKFNLILVCASIYFKTLLLARSVTSDSVIAASWKNVRVTGAFAVCAGSASALASAVAASVEATAVAADSDTVGVADGVAAVLPQAASMASTSSIAVRESNR